MANFRNHIIIYSTKIIFVFTLLSFFSVSSYSQITGSFIVKGNISTYYPVIFTDNGYAQNVATELAIGRSGVHLDSMGRGSIIAKFYVHVNNWGNGSSFINADIHQNGGYTPVIDNFIGGWKDASVTNNNSKFIIWLRGGTTTYYYNSNYAVSPVVYDGIQNVLPYQETNGPTDTYKTSADPYVNITGTSLANSLYVNGAATNYFNGNVGIGTTSPQTKLHVAGTITGYLMRFDEGNGYVGFMGRGASISPSGWASTPDILSLNYFSRDFAIGGWGKSDGLWKGASIYINSDNGNVLIGKTSQTNTGYKLDVNGNVRANKITVNTTGADFVFDSSYQLLSLNEVENFIQQNHHLPEIASAVDMQADGVDVGENQTKLLQKTEELTLYLIEQSKKLKEQSDVIATQSKQINDLELVVRQQQKDIEKLIDQDKNIAPSKLVGDPKN